MINLESISQESDWKEVDRVQRLAYSEELVEDLDVLKEKANIAGHFCFLIRNETSSEVLGYVLAHPYPKNRIPPLNEKQNSSSDTDANIEDNVFLHDMALDPSCSGKGLGKKAVELLIEEVKSKGGKGMTLIAVQSSSSFWNKVAGFEIVDSKDNASLAKYGEGAKIMQMEF